MRELCVSGFRGTKLVKVSRDAAECSLEHLVGLLNAPPRKDSIFSKLIKPFFPAQPELPSLLVASRNADTSHSMDSNLLRANPAVKVVWMVRNPLDILTSLHADRPGQFYMKPQKALSALDLYRRFKNEPQVLTVHYEELVSDPNAVQTRIAKAFQIETVRDFTDGHKYFPRFSQNVRALHSIRPVDMKSLQKWKTNPEYKSYLQKILGEYPQLRLVARECGYEINLA